MNFMIDNTRPSSLRLVNLSYLNHVDNCDILSHHSQIETFPLGRAHTLYSDCKSGKFQAHKLHMNQIQIRSQVSIVTFYCLKKSFKNFQKNAFNLEHDDHKQFQHYLAAMMHCAYHKSKFFV